MDMKITGTFMVKQTLTMFVEGCEHALLGQECMANRTPPYEMGYQYGLSIMSRFTLAKENKELK
tara:strand:+ start:745 stop:936 length:192 start_codon:yes stop_codon:yes gene_type:complete